METNHKQFTFIIYLENKLKIEQRAQKKDGDRDNTPIACSSVGRDSLPIPKQLKIKLLLGNCCKNGPKEMNCS